MFDVDLAQYGDSPCLITQEKSFSYKELASLCSSFEESFPPSKQLIVIRAGVDIETIIGYLASLRANHALIMLDAKMDEALFYNIVASYHPNFIWEKTVDEVDYLFRYKRYGLRSYNKNRIDLHPKLSLMLSTSGTTGSPKMVKLTKENLYSNCKAIVDYLHVEQNHVAISNLPFHYSYGISVLNTHLAKGASLVVTDNSIMSKEFWNILNEHKVTTLSGVPYHYEIFRRIGIFKMGLPSLRYMTQAGGKLNPKLVKEFALWAGSNQIAFFIMYGQTEATARISYLPPSRTIEKDKSIGIPIPNGELMIKDLQCDTTIDQAFVEGELLYRGTNVMMGYATTVEDLSKEDELKGVLATGDVAYRDEEGYFYITGRLKRFIKIHGNRVGLDEIEQFLKSKFYNTLCVGTDNRLMIATTKREDAEAIKQELVKMYGIHHSVIKVAYLEQYPITSAGKIAYNRLMEIFK